LRAAARVLQNAELLCRFRYISHFAESANILAGVSIALLLHIRRQRIEFASESSKS
jgi:hypothetical protein